MPVGNHRLVEREREKKLENAQTNTNTGSNGEQQGRRKSIKKMRKISVNTLS
jgi:hypothetical protein